MLLKTLGLRKKMKILIIGKPFYNYHEIIANEFRLMKDTVTFISDSPKNHFFIKRLFGSKIEKRYIERYHKRLFKSKIEKDFDLILVLVGRYLTKDFMAKLKEMNPSSKFVLYLWDDIGRVDNFNLLKDFYDKIYSFDLNDCKNYNITFLPLFYSRDYKLGNYNKNIDIYGAFSDHSERKKIAYKIISQSIGKRIKCKFIFFPGRFKYIINYIKNKKIQSKTNNKMVYVYAPIDDNTNLNYVFHSKALLDVQYKTQNGLTMRTIESIGAGVKLITTNTNIMKYDFYRSENCLIIDRDNPVIDFEFLQTPYLQLPNDIYSKYSIETWVSVIRNEISKVYFNDIE